MDGRGVEQRHGILRRQLRRPLAQLQRAIVVTFGLGDRDLQRQQVGVVLGQPPRAGQRGDGAFEITLVEAIQASLHQLFEASFGTF